MVTQIGLREMDAAALAAEIEAFLPVYAAAMNPPAIHLPGRRAIMERHRGYPRFRCVSASSTGDPCSIIAFAYGFHGESGQWWHDLVNTAIAASAGGARARAWLGDSFEIGEVHVHPDYQNRGAGRAMMLALTAPCSERTAVLSTRDTASPARHLYRKLGFSDLLSQFCFPGGPERYAVMGAALPLPSG